MAPLVRLLTVVNARIEAKHWSDEALKQSDQK